MTKSFAAVVVLTMGLVLGLAACGPSAAQVKVAKEARYKASVDVIFDVAVLVAKEQGKLFGVDPESRVVVTLPRWHKPDGGLESAGVGDAVLVGDGALLVALKIMVVDDDAGLVRVDVVPVVERFRMGQSQHDVLAPDDPSMPGWVLGKVDAMALAIHQRAKVHAVPAAAPAPAP
ncbi:MAG: hypothetical protein KBG28_22865 [Kofleriaceae bacterium]|nr:hypothetical protein [Kofleriaceae bacterium]